MSTIASANSIALDRSRLMPFTVAHAAAILPVYRISGSRLPLSALIIGSMAPDFAYFAPFEIGLASHSLAGLIGFCWPVGFMAWLLFTRVLAGPTSDLLSPRIATLDDARDPVLTAATFMRVSIALLVGAVTHIVWDAFTHASSPVVAAIPQLRVAVLQVDHATIRVYKVLQHLSSLVGLAALAMWTYARWRDQRAQQPIAANRASHASLRRTQLVAVGALLTTSWTCAVVNYLLHADIRLERRLFHFAIGGMNGWVAAWTVIAVLLTWRSRRESRR